MPNEWEYSEFEARRDAFLRGQYGVSTPSTDSAPTGEGAKGAAVAGGGVGHATDSSTREAPFQPPRPGPVETDFGAVHLRRDVAGIKEAWKDIEKRPNERYQQVYLAGGLTGDPHIPSDEKELEEASAPRWYESIFHWMEPFDYPRRALWMGAYKAGSLLPDPTSPGEDTTAISTAGDTLQRVTGKALGFALAHSDQTPLGWLFGEDVTEEHADLTEQVAESLYNAVATGRMYDLGKLRRGPATWGAGTGGGLPFIDIVGEEGVGVPYPTGTDLLNQSVPHELAEELAETAPTPVSRHMWKLLTSEAGREAVGLALEIAVDPLWFYGPAAGAKSVAKGDKVITLTRKANRAASAAARATGTTDATATKHVVNLLAGSGDEVKEAQEFLGTARNMVADAQASSAAKAARLADSAKDPKRAITSAQQRLAAELEELQAAEKAWEGAEGSAEALRVLRRKVSETERELATLGTDAGKAQALLKHKAQVYSRQADKFRADLGHLDKALDTERAGLAVEKGSIALHVPFADGTKYLLPAGTKAKVWDAVPSPVARVLTAPARAAKPYAWDALTTELKAAYKAEQRIPDVIAAWPAPKQLAYGAQRTLNKTLNLGRAGWQALTQIVGHRFMQPLVQRAEALESMKQYGSRGKFLHQVDIGGSRWLKIEKVAPEVWEKYHESVTRYWRKSSHLEQDLIHHVNRINRAADRTARVLQAEAKADLPRVKRLAEKLTASLMGADNAGSRSVYSQQLRKVRDLEARYNRRLDKTYGAQAVWEEAADAMETGADFMRQHPEFMPIADEVNQLVAFHAEKLGTEAEEVRQSLVNMARFMEGNPMEADAVAAALQRAEELMRSAHTEAKWKSIRIRSVATARRAQLSSFRELIGNLNPEGFASTLERINAGVKGFPYDEGIHADHIRSLLLDHFGSEATVERILDHAALIMGEPNGETAVRALAAMVMGAVPEGKPTTGRTLANAVKELLGDMDANIARLDEIIAKGGPVEAEAEALIHALMGTAEILEAKARARMGEDAWDLFRAWVRATPSTADPYGQSARDFALSIFKGVPDEKAVENLANTAARARRDWEKASASVSKAADLERALPERRLLARAAGDTKAGDAALRTEVAEGLERLGVSGRRLGVLAKDNLMQDRIQRALKGATSETDATKRVRAALDELLPTDDPAVARMADKVAAQLGPDLYRSPPPLPGTRAGAGGQSAVDALTAARKRAQRVLTREQKWVDEAAEEAGRIVKERTGDRVEFLSEYRARLKAKAKEVEAKLPPPLKRDVPMGPRELEKWESELWSDFAKMTENMTDENRLRAAFTALRESPEDWTDPRLSKLLGELQKKNTYVHGQRMGKMDPALQPVVDELRSLIRSYEELYLQHGMDFMKSPDDMLRSWGVFEYVPHMATPANLIARGKVTGHAFVGGSMADKAQLLSQNTLDGRLSMSMDAARKRVLQGTMRELNANLLGLDEAVSYTMDPQMLIARYMQSNGAMAAKEFMLSMLENGVVKAVHPRSLPDGTTLPASLVAEDMDMVPLFRRGNVDRDLELFVRGGLDDWRKAGLTPEQVEFMAKEIRTWAATAGKRGYSKEVTPFGNWLKDVPELRSAAVVEDGLFSIRAQQYRKMETLAPDATTSLFDPHTFQKSALADPANSERIAAALKKARTLAKRRGQTGDELALALDDALKLEAWKITADEFNRLASRAGAQERVSGKQLSMYYAPDQELWRLYVPRAVAQSMNDIFDIRPDVGGATKKWWDRVNGWWKTRVTVLAIPFSTRNKVSNDLSNMLDLGPMGALNPKTQMLASKTATAAGFAERYGGMETASRYLRLPDLAGETKLDRARRKAELALWKSSGMDKLVREGLDLGDGIVRSVDEALDVLKEHGVLSGSYNQYIDVSMFERNLADMVLTGGVKGDTEKLLGMAKTGQFWEDILVTAVPTMMTGGVPVSVPKDIGAWISRAVENQARFINFYGNMRKTGNIADSADHVDKFLFNYDDLTSTQKVWARSLVPFFTWTAKNIHLQMEMSTKAPVYYAQFNRMLLTGLPRISQAVDVEEGEGFMPQNAASPDALKLRRSHTRGMVRIPLPEKLVGGEDVYLEGLGMPLEAFVEQMGMLGAMLDLERVIYSVAGYHDEKPMLRFLGQSHWVAKMAVEMATRQHIFYDRPIEELTNGRLVNAMTQTIREYGDALMPGVGSSIALQIEHVAGLHRTQPYNSYSGTYDPDIIVNGGANWLFSQAPWMRVIRDASAATDVFHLSLAASALETSGGEYHELPPWTRLLDALSGIRITQEDMALRQRVWEAEQQRAVGKMLTARGVTRELDLRYIPKEP